MKITQENEREIRPGMLVTNVVLTPYPSSRWPLLVLDLLVLEVGRWVECLDPDGSRSLHPLVQLRILETDEAQA